MLKALAAAAAAAAAALALATGTADASDVFYTCYPDLCRVRPDGSGKKRLTDDGEASNRRYEDISASRDGRLAFSLGDDVFLADRNARHRKRLHDAYGTLLLHPDGNHVMWFALPQLNPRWCRGTLDPLAHTCKVMFRNRRDYLAWGPKHSLLTTDLDTRQTICTTRIDADREAACKHRILAEHDSNWFFLRPSLSPDEHRLATATGFGFGTSTTSIAVYDLDTGKLLHRLTSGYDDELPVWSPDGRSIAFVRHYPDGSHAAVRVRASGGKAKVLARRKAGIYEVAWGG